MRTNIVLDDELVKEAFTYSDKIHTKKELIHVALKEYINNHKLKDLRDLRGKIQFSDDYDFRKMRTM